MSSQPQFAFCSALVDALVANGVRHAAVSPGSRNTPLLVALGAHRGIDLTVHHDERTGAFFALGLAKATGRPTVLCCTSGTAATEYMPAITEARMAHVPLVVLTADRPPELQDRGAPQTINQTNLYGPSAKWFYDTGVPETDATADAAHLARQAVSTSIEAPAGPVHINVPLREPLVPSEPIVPVPAATAAALPTVTRPIADEPALRSTAEIIREKRVAFIAGQTPTRNAGSAILELAEASDGIVFADPQSDARFNGADHPRLVSLGDLLIASGVDLPAPEAIVHFGAIHTSKPLNEWIAALGVPLIHVHNGQWHDPLGVATSVVFAEPATTATQLAKLAQPPARSFAEQWRVADDRASSSLTAIPPGSEPDVARTVVDAMTSSSVLVAGSSMPIRLVDSYAVRRNSPLQVISNRGANGIDGTIATTLGVAAAGPAVTAFIGDLTALADVGSLAALATSEASVTLVVLNNDGGGIFDFLPQSDETRVSSDVYRSLIKVPHGLSLAAIASGFGLDATRAATVADLRELLTGQAKGPRLIEIDVASGTGPQARLAVLDAIRS